MESRRGSLLAPAVFLLLLFLLVALPGSAPAQGLVPPTGPAKIGADVLSALLSERDEGR